MLPNFILAGAPKAGTTSMNRYLHEHPEIFMPAQKGLHYFSSAQLLSRVKGPGDLEAVRNICRSRENYLGYYQDVPTGCKAAGDASPSYLFFQECISGIIDLLGKEVKVLVMVRNPIDRAFSNYLHMVNTGREKLSFLKALEAEDERAQSGWGDFWQYKNHSLYAERLKRYIEAFGADQVKVIVHDDFARDTASIVKEVYRFLGVDDRYTPANIGIVYGKTGLKRHPALIKLLERPSAMKSAGMKVIPQKALRKIKIIKDGFIQKNTWKQVAPDDRSIRYLKTYFRADIESLEDILGKDLSSWK